MTSWKLPAAGIAVVAIVIAGWAATLWADLPGHLSYDSVVQLLEGRTGLYGTWHPPVMSWLLGLFDAIVPGTALFVFLDATLAFGAFLSLLRLGRPTWSAAIVALLCVLSPQFLIYQGIVWKDVLFANASVAGFVALAHAARLWDRPRARFLLIAAAFALLVLGALARQNGAVVCVPAIVALGWIAAKNAPSQYRLRTAATYAAATLVGVVLVGIAAIAALNTRSIPDALGPVGQAKILQDYDIIAMVSAYPGLELPQLEDTEPDLADAIRTEGVRLYTPQRNDTLASSRRLQSALAQSEVSEVRDQWVYLVLHHPWLYLKVRTAAFRWVAFTPDISRCVPFAVGVGGPPGEMQQLGIAPRLDARDLALSNYGSALTRTPVFSHATFGIIAIAAMILLFRRRTTADIAMGAMLVGSFLFLLTFFVISIACDYRYLYVLDLSAMFAALYVALNPSLLSFGERKS